MVITVKTNDTPIAFMDAMSSTAKNNVESNNTSTAFDIIMKKFKDFVESSFKASSKEEIEAAVDEVFSPCLVIIAGGEERDLDFFKRTIVAASKAPLTSRINFLETVNDSQLRANWSLYVAGIKLFTVDRLLTIDVTADRNGDDAKIVRFEPFEGKTDLYTKIKQFFGLANKADVDVHLLAERFREFLDFNPNGKCPSEMETIIDETFSRSLVVVIEEGEERDLAFFKQTCLKAMLSGFSRKVIDLNVVDRRRIQVSYNILIDGEAKKELHCNILLTAADGKIIRFEPNEESKNVYKHMQKYLVKEEARE